jgi:DNA-binding NarL/FixJ family response regulator
MTNGHLVTAALGPATLPAPAPMGTPRRVPRVAVVNGNPMARRALTSLVCGAAGIACVGHYGSVEQALRGLAGAPADVLLLDPGDARETVTVGIRRLRTAHPETAVIVLVAQRGEGRVFESLCCGAVGCVLTSSSPARLLMAIEDAAAGGSPISPEIARVVVTLFQRAGPPGARTAPLTPRERAVLTLLSRGRTYGATAAELGVSVNTVRNYVRAIYEKLQVHSKSEAVAAAFRQGLI